MSSIGMNHPMHPFAEFLDLISMRIPDNNVRQKINIVYVEPNDSILEKQFPTSKNHQDSDTDDWGQRAITKQLASGNQIPSPKRKF